MPPRSMSKPMAAVERVIAFVAEEHVVAVFAEKLIVAVAAVERCRCQRRR